MTSLGAYSIRHELLNELFYFCICPQQLAKTIMTNCKAKSFCTFFYLKFFPSCKPSFICDDALVACFEI